MGASPQGAIKEWSNTGRVRSGGGALGRLAPRCGTSGRDCGYGVRRRRGYGVPEAVSAAAASMRGWASS